MYLMLGGTSNCVFAIEGAIGILTRRANNATAYARGTGYKIYNRDCKTLSTDGRANATR